MLRIEYWYWALGVRAQATLEPGRVECDGQARSRTAEYVLMLASPTEHEQVGKRGGAKTLRGAVGTLGAGQYLVLSAGCWY